MGFQTGGGGAPTDAQYVVLATDADLSDERTLNAGTLLSETDGGAGNDVTLAVQEASIDHGSITGLGDDDHDQYTLGQSDDIRIQEVGGFQTSVPAATDGTWDTQNDSSISSSFDVAFSSSSISIAYSTDFDNPGFPQKGSKSTTALSTRLVNYSTSSETIEYEAIVYGPQ